MTRYSKPEDILAMKKEQNFYINKKEQMLK